MRTGILILGFVVMAAGLFWAAQGLGWIQWPVPAPGQFTMVNNSPWIYYGAATAAAGLLILFAARRR